jgi:hypothetical protein
MTQKNISVHITFFLIGGSQLFYGNKKGRKESKKWREIRAQTSLF